MYRVYICIGYVCVYGMCIGYIMYSVVVCV